MKIKAVLGDRKIILKFTILAAGVLIVLLVAMIGITYSTSVPRFCSVCHIMKPEFATWEASDHSQVACVACHVDPGLTSALKHKVVATKELYMYVTKTYELPIQMTEDIPDSRCLRCHSTKRKVSPSYPGLNIPHDLHAAQKIPCVKCHQGVAHGKIASRGMTLGGDFNQWDKAKGTGVMTAEYTLPKMDLCMDCHGRRGVTVACEACHSGSMKPESHQQQSFKLNHGQLAEKNIASCDVCHAYIKAPGVTPQDMPEEDPVAKYLDSLASGSGTDYAQYAKTNEFCVNCHQKRPPSHDRNWPFKHGQAAEKSEKNCLICHSPRTDIQGTNAKGACSSCHPSIHKNADWRKAHPIDVPPKLGVLQPRCLECHAKAVCTSCHGVREQNTTSLPTAIVSVEPENTANIRPDQQSTTDQ